MLTRFLVKLSEHIYGRVLLSLIMVGFFIIIVHNEYVASPDLPIWKLTLNIAGSAQFVSFTMMVMVFYKMGKVETLAGIIADNLKTLQADFKGHMERFHEKK